MTIAAVLGSKGHEVETLTGDSTLMDAVRTLAAKRIGALPVVEGARIVGIISERDVIYCLSSKGAEALDLPVSEVMSSPAITADKEVGVLSALALMTQRRIRHLPVLDGGGGICGIVSIGDLVKHRMERIEAEAEAMRAYIQSA
jgi:CBS domain-containing protein